MTDKPDPRRPRPHTRTIVRRAARRLELRSFGLLPELFNHVEGLRAAVAVALPLVLAVTTGRAGLGWAVFAAFWTCLCDSPGPDTQRRRLLAIFVGCGTVISFAGSWIASFAPMAGMIAGPTIVFCAVLSSARIRFGGLLGTLLAVVGVVAVGFPHPPAQAAVQAGAFLGGAVWAYLLINAIWRIDAALPLSRASDAVVVRLLDMAESLVQLGDAQHRDDRWHREHAEHRRAVRLAIERFRSMLERYGEDPSATARFEQDCEACETLFGALIALDQAYIIRAGRIEERAAVAHACKTTLLAWALSSRSGGRRRDPLDWAAGRLRRLQGQLTDDLFIGCLRAFESALEGLACRQSGTHLQGKVGQARLLPGTSPVALRQAVRQSVGLVVVYLSAIVFQLGYPYWAAMALVVVLQGGARVTWARCLERILGSVLGGMLAWLLVTVSSASPALVMLAVILAGAAIAMRSVNYTIFVIFLTMLFVIVAEMLQPGAGIASSRMLDNVIGSVTALIAVFTLWPDFGASLKNRIDEGIDANRRYFEAVRRNEPVAEIEQARRGAGLASVEAEIALHDVGGMLRRLFQSGHGGEPLQDLRNTAGEAAMAWHRRLGAQVQSRPIFDEGRFNQA